MTVVLSHLKLKLHGLEGGAGLDGPDAALLRHLHDGRGDGGRLPQQEVHVQSLQLSRIAGVKYGVDPNTLHLDPDSEFWPHLDPDPDPGLCYQFCIENVKIIIEEDNFLFFL